jgi:hypothetical protein
VRRHTESNNLIIFAVILKLQRVMALIAVNNKQSVAANHSLLCMPIKVLQPRKPKLISRPAVIRDTNNPVVGYISVLIPACEVVMRLKDNKGWDSPPCRIDALDNCCPLSVA